MTGAQGLIARIAAAPRRVALCCDFDGTLAPIVADPARSRLPDGLADVLATLAPRLGVLAVVSGRPARFLGERADVAGVRRLGLYGLEEWRDGAGVARAEAASWQPEVDRAVAALSVALAGEQGVTIEDKGLSVAVHWRNAPDPAAAEARVTREMARLSAVTGLLREPGKLVDELRPPVDWDKGRTVRAIAAEVSADLVVYIGDDLGDLAAFAATRELGGVAVAVDHGKETPLGVLEEADLVLDGPDGVRAFLDALAARLA